MVNISGYSPTPRLALDGHDLYDGRTGPPARSGWMLPFGLTCRGRASSGPTPRSVPPGRSRVAFGPGLGHADDPTATVVVLRTDREVPETEAYAVERDGAVVRVTSRPGAGPLEVTPA